jgi:hypothetical protein
LAARGVTGPEPVLAEATSRFCGLCSRQVEGSSRSRPSHMCQHRPRHRPPAKIASDEA